MEEKYCQSCAMPMGDSKNMYGRNKDESISKDYCKYCYDKGEFLADVNIEQMINICIPHMLDANKNMSEEQARKIMSDFMPTLKRWKQ